MKLAAGIPPFVVGYDWFYTDARGIRRKGPPVVGMITSLKPLKIGWFRV